MVCLVCVRTFRYSFDDIRSIVEFMYRGEVMVAETAMQRLLAAAEDLQIKGLSNVRSKRDGGGGTGHGQHHDAADEQEEEDDGDGGGGGINLQQQQQQQHQMGVQDCSNKSSASGGSPNSAKDFGNQSQQASNNENGSGGGKGPGLYKRRKRARAGSPVNNQVHFSLPDGTLVIRMPPPTCKFFKNGIVCVQTKRKLRTSGSQQKQGSLSPRDNDSTVADDLRMNVDDSKAEPLIKDPSELMMMINVDPHHQQQDDDDDKQSGSGGGNNKDGTGSTSGDERNNSEGGGNNNGGSGNGKSGGNNIVSVGMIPLESLVEPKEKIPRPPNSFMIFANEWRRQLAGQFPNESNKEISVRLGVMWKNLTDDVKVQCFHDYDTFARLLVT